MQRPEDSDLSCCFPAWRPAGWIKPEDIQGAVTKQHGHIIFYSGFNVVSKEGFSLNGEKRW
jgi:hypothetical protein